MGIFSVFTRRPKLLRLPTLAGTKARREMLSLFVAFTAYTASAPDHAELGVHALQECAGFCAGNTQPWDFKCEPSRFSGRCAGCAECQTLQQLRGTTACGLS